MKMTRFNPLLISIFFVSVLWSGCSSKYIAGRGYDGLELPKDNVAIIRGDRIGRFLNDQYVTICKIDNNVVTMDKNNRSVDVLPGSHIIKVLYSAGKLLNAVDLTFKVEAGHQYLITFDKKSVWETQFDPGFYLWIEDVNKNEKVMDVTSSPLKSPFSCF